MALPISLPLSTAGAALLALQNTSCPRKPQSPMTSLSLQGDWEGPTQVVVALVLVVAWPQSQPFINHSVLEHQLTTMDIKQPFLPHSSFALLAFQRHTQKPKLMCPSSSFMAPEVPQKVIQVSALFHSVINSFRTSEATLLLITGVVLQASHPPTCTLSRSIFNKGVLHKPQINILKFRLIKSRSLRMRSV